MTMLDAVLGAHAFATLALVGLIWFVQVVQYPMFAVVAEDFEEVHRSHMQRTGWVVAPLMLLELVTAVAFFAMAPVDLRTTALVGAILLAVVWGSTWLLQVPLHKRLQDGGSDRAGDIERLVRTNWIRTTAWSGRGLVALASLQASSL